MKLRLVVIDDEVFVRRGIISSIDWEAHGIEIAGEAYDGNSGLDLIRAAKPDIVITDIRMPNIDGLQLICQAQEECPGTKFLILSVLEEFQAVQEALRLGVAGYISKMSMMPEELLEAVLKIRDRHPSMIAQQSNGQPEAPDLHQNAELEQWMRGRDSERYTALLRDGCGFMLARIAVDDAPGEGFHAEKTPYAKQWVDSVVHTDEHARMREVIAFQATENRVSLLIVLSEPSRQEEVVSLWQHKINKLKPRFILTVGLSAVMHRAEDREQALEQANQALEQRFFAGNGQVYPYRQEAAPEPLRDMAFIGKQALSHYLMTLEQEDEAQSMAAFHQLFPDRINKDYTQKAVRDDIYYWVSSVLIHMKERGIALSSVFGNESPFDQIDKLGTYPAIHAWCLRLHTVVLTMLNNQRNMLRHEIVKAIAYTKSHYMNAIRVKEVADMVHLSESYFSNVFTKETGKTFSQYLLDVRIEKAKQLLQADSLSWLEVGEQTGFENPKYFTKVFKKHTGITPRQYAESRK